MIRRPLHRADGNKTLIVKALRGVGVAVHDLDDPMDLLTGFRGVFRVIEIKNGDNPPSKKKLRKSQEKFSADFAGCPIYKVETIGEAMAAHGISFQG